MNGAGETRNRLGVVIIGRNEGERLVRCLASVKGVGARVIYVDSGSTDGSVQAAREAGAEVVELDLSTPFTAARARNAGMNALGLAQGLHPQTEPKTDPKEGNAPEFIQFIDGDCEMHPDWLETAAAFLQANERVAVVTGRLRERHPEASAYNALCDAEWDGPKGQVDSCGGIAMMRSAALAQTTLYNPRMIAGEEPELCLRLRRAGWTIWRLEDEMAWHDAALLRFGQFWTRMRRGGFAFALWADMHGAPPDRLGVAQMRRALLWGAVLPFALVLAMLVFGAGALALWLIYPAQVARLALRGEGWGNATLLTIGKFAEARGVIEFYFRKWSGRPAGLIEHK